ncbi:MAG: YfhO family protein [Candidatus Sumerlaeaceae bacterium]|nr:YfhO family protein [Candidatus Sumerlaeaceae bacterium]
MPQRGQKSPFLNLLLAASPYLLTAFLTFLVYTPLLRPYAHVFTTDYKDFNFPIRYYATASLDAGRLPHWTDNIFGGYPFLTDPQTAVFSPSNLLLYLLGPHPLTTRAMDWFLVANVVLVALGATFFARAFGLSRLGAVAASILMTHNGFIPMHLGHVQFNQTIGYGYLHLGLLLLALKRGSWRYAVASGLAGAAVVFSGFPQLAMHVFLMSGIGTALFGIRDALRLRALKPLLPAASLGLLALAVALLASMVQILPVPTLLTNSNRRVLDLSVAQGFSMPWQGYWGLIAPGLFQTLPARLPNRELWFLVPHNVLTDGAWEYLYFIGLVAAVLGIVGWTSNARRGVVWILGLVTAFLLLCAPGSETGVYQYIYHYVPGFKQVRIPTRMMWVAWTCWGLLVGMGAETIARATCAGALVAARRAVVTILSTLWLAGAAMVGIAWLQTRDWYIAACRLLVLSPTSHWAIREPALFLGDILFQLIITAALTVIVISILVWLARRGRGAAAAAAVLVALMFAEIASYGIHKNIVIDVGGGITSVLPRQYKAVVTPMTGRFLFDSRGDVMKNQAMIAGTRHANGYMATVLLWHMLFAPREKSPLGRLSEENARDEWNLTHYVMDCPRTTATIAGRRLELPFRGSTWLAAEEGFPNDRQTAIIEDGKSVRKIHVLANAAAAAGLPNDFVVGQVILADAAGTTSCALPLRIGRELAEWSYDLPIHPAAIGHMRPPVAFVGKRQTHNAEGGNFYEATFDAPTTFTLGRITVQATAPPPTYLSLSHLVLDRNGQMEIHPATEGLGSIVEPSGLPELTVLRRPTALGFAWGVPTGKSVSYKDGLRYVRDKYWNATFQPRQEVLLNKQQLPRESLESLNAPDPATFAGTVDFKKPVPERTEVRVSFSQRGWLVISELWYPGWTAKLDGKPVDLIRANGAHSAVAVPAGDHLVTLEYRTPGFAAGAAISGVTWLFAVLALLSGAMPRRRQPAAKAN